MNYQDFNKYIKSLPNNSGLGIYFLECSISQCSYDPMKNQFCRVRDLKSGYRPYSMSTTTPLTEKEEDEVYDDVSKNAFILVEYFLHTKKRVILLNGFNL